MSRRRAVLLATGLLLMAVVVLGGVVGWRALQVNDALQEAVRDAYTLQATLESGEQEDIDAALAALQASASDARGLTDGPIWGLATMSPFVGDDAEGVRIAARVVADLSEEGIGPLARTATELDGLLPRDGRIDIEALRALQEPVATAAASLAGARKELATQDSSGFIARFRSEYRELVGLVDDAASAMDSARVTVGLLPELLGSEERRTYLLVFQNNAEIRATGGLPGAMALIETLDGTIKLARQDTAGAFGERRTPVLPLGDDERMVFGEQLGTYIQDANFTPDWPRAAELIRARWEERHPQDELDGVLTIDTVAISYLLEATGPIDVGAYSLTAENAVATLLNQAYIDFPDPAEQNSFFGEVARTVFDAVSSGQVQRPRGLLRELIRGGAEGRIYVHLTDPAEQSQIESRRIAGTLDGEATESGIIHVALLDGTGSKMSYYLDYDVTADVTSCSAGATNVVIRARLVSNPPEDPDSLPASITGGTNTSTMPGNQLVQVRLLAPPRASISAFSIRGKSYSPRSLFLDDRQVSTAYLLLEPRKPADIEWTVSISGDWTRRPVRVTPGLEPIDYSTEVVREC